VKNGNSGLAFVQQYHFDYVHGQVIGFTPAADKTELKITELCKSRCDWEEN
jgi:phenylpropionate dioxygenase-like ring-hydroxylating dioxygenase large terminal subunit